MTARMLFDRRWLFRGIRSGLLVPLWALSWVDPAIVPPLLLSSLMWVVTRLFWECFRLTYPSSLQAGSHSNINGKGICSSVEVAYHSHCSGIIVHFRWLESGLIVTLGDVESRHSPVANMTIIALISTRNVSMWYVCVCKKGIWLLLLL